MRYMHFRLVEMIFFLKHSQLLGNKKKERKKKPGKLGDEMAYQEDSEEWKETWVGMLSELFTHVVVLWV